MEKSINITTKEAYQYKIKLEKEWNNQGRKYYETQDAPFCKSYTDDQKVLTELVRNFSSNIKNMKLRVTADDIETIKQEIKKVKQIVK